MRLMGFLFLCLTFVAGVTVGTVEVALINVIVFLALALLALRYLEPRFGPNGAVFGMAGAFFASFLWPAVVHALRDEATCAPGACATKDPDVTVTLSLAP